MNEKNTTISLPVPDRDEIKRMADLRGIKAKHAPGVLIEGWKLLTSEQAKRARERYFARRNKVA